MSDASLHPLDGRVGSRHERVGWLMGTSVIRSTEYSVNWFPTQDSAIRCPDASVRRRAIDHGEMSGPRLRVADWSYADGINPSLSIYWTFALPDDTFCASSTETRLPQLSVGGDDAALTPRLASSRRHQFHHSHYLPSEWPVPPVHRTLLPQRRPQCQRSISPRHTHTARSTG